tara:strand:+ start:2297 stop:3256 length:960 start_codon:yes stop_codon:yes gene_type:complete
MFEIIELPDLDLDLKQREKIQKIIFDYIIATILKPLVSANGFNKTIIKNAKLSDLEKAINKGKVYYKDGYLKGKFTASIIREITKLGGYYRKGEGFLISKATLPTSIITALDVYEQSMLDSYAKTMQTLNNIDTDTVNNLNFDEEYQDILNTLDFEVKQSVKDIAVIPEVTARMKKEIAKNYSENLKYYIKKFADKEIFELRKAVQENFFEGFRTSKLAETIKYRYGVSERKAKFLAKQETDLLYSFFTTERYKDAGVKSFVWTRTTSKVPDKYHETLVGKEFSFDNLPIINLKTGQRGVPKQRWNCSCGMRPVLKVVR